MKRLFITIARLLQLLAPLVVIYFRHYNETTGSKLSFIGLMLIIIYGFANVVYFSKKVKDMKAEWLHGKISEYYYRQNTFVFRTFNILLAFGLVIYLFYTIAINTQSLIETLGIILLLELLSIIFEILYLRKIKKEAN